ncbi:MAG TPA: type ISP restriction/modification enzyme [Actinomycetota bacterium]|nr:type ISP restriction/modification enzyme [Actinomycetota bacterium]
MPAAESLHQACRTYLNAVRAIRATSQHTREQSFYTPLNNLLDALVTGAKPARRAMGHPAGIDGDFPDVALYEVAANVLVLPFEVKPPSADVVALGKSAQARRYATSFGGGRVLVTNLRQFALARLDGTSMVVDTSVSLAADEPALDAPVGSLGNSPAELANLLDEACSLRATITDPSSVATFLAFHARHMRDSIVATGEPGVMLAPIQKAFADGLGITLPDKLLVATVVQTLVYGLLAAWLDDEHPQEFDWMESSYRLEVPVFADILHAALRPALIRRCKLKQHLDAIGRLLMWVNRDVFDTKFEGGAIEYFYEPFLAKFDEDLRDQLGVWYTPREIADYQVARADHHLRTDLGIAAGITHESVFILDPACGTGTYLGAVLRSIHNIHISNGEPPEVALSRTIDAATSRVIGFEILPAAFVISHLHIGRLLSRLGAGELPDRLRVYLTNSLTGWPPNSPPEGLTLFPELEDELRDAAKVKHYDPVLVILGNPPYQGYSTAETDEERELLRAWITPLWPVWGLRKHRMNDLYVRFWRMSIEKIASLTGRGVVSFITNRKWLGGRSYPTMREAVATRFEHVVVDDLHGAVDDHTHPGDQSVFMTAIASGITRGTAIVTAVRARAPAAPAAVRSRDLWGSSVSKRARLAAWRDASIDDGLVPVATDAARQWKFTADTGGDFPSIDEYLTTVHSGVQSVRDAAVMAEDRVTLETRMRDYFDASLPLEQIVASHPGFGVERVGYNALKVRQNLLSSSSFQGGRLVRFLYRPFDVRWLYWEPDHKLLNRARPAQMPYWLTIPQQRCVVLPQTPRRVHAARPVVSTCVGSFAAAEPDARLFPLYEPGALHGVGATLPSAGDPPVPLVAREWIAAARLAGTGGTDVEIAEILFHALVAVMNSPTWLDDQPVEADDFAQVPLPADPVVLADAAVIGRRIADLNDPTVDVLGITSGAIDPAFASIGVPDTASGAVTLELGRFGQAGGQRHGSDVLWGDGKAWRNVPDDVWTFTACGHTVLPKWLSYRVGGRLSSIHRQTFMLLCRRVAAIRALESTCDAVYAAASADLLST